MMDNNYSVRDIRILNLNKIYKRYTDYLINMEKHINRVYADWVIDINNRNYILNKLNSVIKSMIKIYNSNVKQIRIECNDGDIANIGKDKLYIMNKVSDGLDLLDMIEGGETDNPFAVVKTEMISISKKNGMFNMSDFLKLYIGDKYTFFLDNVELFELYDKVFVPLGATICDVGDNAFVVTKNDEKYDGLMDRTCDIVVSIKMLDIAIKFDGYIAADVLNIYSRASLVYSKHIHSIKSVACDIIKKSYPHVTDQFINNYVKLVNNSCYFVHSAEGLANKIVIDCNLLISLNNKHFNLIMKEFTHNDVKTMYNIINILLMGCNQNISTAARLFEILKDKKIGSGTLSDIIYHNLSFYSQMKLKKIIYILKDEMTRIKTLSPDNIPLEKRLSSLINMPDNVKTYILEKINEIKSGENNYKLQMAINGLMQFPWKPLDNKNEFADINKSMIKSRNYLQNVANRLNDTVYGHETSKKVLIELVGKWIQNPESTGQVIGLVGPPGVGKTLLAKSISLALDIPLSIVGLGGMSDSADLIGHSFTYAGAQYGMIVRQMIKSGNWRSVMFFDEVDKVSKRNDTNEIYNTLIHITDPNMNQHFQDRFYSSSIEFDLSGVLIVFSYNDSSKLDQILLDRIKEIHISAYSTQEKISIAQNYMIKELCTNIGFDRTRIHFDDVIIRYIIEKYTMEAGVRELRRKIEQILLKLNIDRFYMRGPFRELMRKKYIEINGTDINININNIVDPLVNFTNSIASTNSDLFFNDTVSQTQDNTDIVSYVKYKRSKYEDLLDPDILDDIFNLKCADSIVISQDLIYKYLEKPLVLTERIHQTDMVGVINGLYATSIGMGGIVPIQIYKNYIGDSHSGDGINIKLKLTGNQKQVMRESVICALTTSVNILNANIRNKIMIKFPNGFHIHAPDGGTPKDGPSAGCAFTTAFVSILLGKKINRNIAMTGEIELTGKVSKIGGLDAKLFGAKKAGVTCVYICEDNREDYENIKKKNPELFDEAFEIKIIKHIVDIVTDPNVIPDINDSDFDPTILSDLKQCNPLST